MTSVSRCFRLALAAALAFWVAAGPAFADSADATRRLFDAVRANDRPKVQSSLADGADVNARNPLGMTPIDIAVDRGFYDLAHFLLAHRSAGTAGTPSPAAPGPLASEPMPVAPVQRSETLGAPGSGPDYVTVPPGPGGDITLSTPPAAPAEPAPMPRLAPGQPNPFDPHRDVQATRAARPAPPPVAAPEGTAPPGASAPSIGNPFSAIKGIFSSTPEPAARPVDKSVDKPVEEKQPDRSVGSAAPAPQAKPPEAAVPAEGPGLMDRLKGIFGSSPDKSSGLEPAASQMAATPPPAPESPAAPPPTAADPVPVAKEQTVSMEQALARLDRAAQLLEGREQVRPAAADPAPAPVAEAVPSEPSGPGFLDRIKGWFEKAETSAPAADQPSHAAEPASPPPSPTANPAPVASWVGRNAAPFDPARPVAAASPLPPEAVPAPPPPSARPPEPRQPPQAALATMPATAKAEPPARTTQPPLKGTPLTLGRSLIVGRIQDSGPEAERNCLRKKAWAATYCVEAADWTEDARPLFEVSSSLYSGMKAVVRYDEGRATRYHAQFPTRLLDRVVDHFEKLLGPPTEIPKPRMAWLGRTREPNDRYIWISEKGAGDRNVILEVRRFDDTSGTFPNSQFGSVQLHAEGAGAIFHELSSLDLTMHSVAPRRTAEPAPKDKDKKR
jgi:hypothetical protein